MFVEEVEENPQFKMEQPNFKIPIDWSKINIFGEEEDKSTLDEKATRGILWRSALWTKEDKQEPEGCSLQEKYKSLTSEVRASTSTPGSLEEVTSRLGMHSFFNTSRMEDEGSTRRLIEISSLVIHEGNRLRREEIANSFGMRSLSPTSAITDGQKELKRWSFLDEISKPFDDALKSKFIEFEEHALICSSTKKEHGDYTCENVLSIWPKLRRERKQRRGRRDRSNRENLKGPKDVGEEIKRNLRDSDLIMKGISIHDVGFITFSLSREWMAKSIYKMLKDGIDTWAPELPVERVIVDYPSLDEEIHSDLFRRRAIGYTLIRMLDFCKVAATIGPTQDIVATFFHRYPERDELYQWARGVLKKWFSIKKRKENMVIKGSKLPFILAKTDFDNAYKDLLALWHGRCVHQADWIVYLTPTRQQEYIEMCFTAAELEKWIPSDRHKPPRTSYAGYRKCTTELSDDLLEEAKTCCNAVALGEAAKFLGYTAEAVLDCVLMHTYLKNHRSAVWDLNIDEMFQEKGNTFVYLLNTQARILRIVTDSCEHIDKLKKASRLILEENAKWGESEERALEFHLLSFTEVLNESCLFILPHVMCEYLYELSKKFNSYYSSVCQGESFAETSTSTLLLCEATIVVMDKCFDLLGLNQTATFFFDLPLSQLPPGLLFSTKRPMDIKARDPPRNSRFELFSVLPSIITDTTKEGKLFGLISISDNYGIVSDGGYHLSESDFAYVLLFEHDWCNAVNMIDCEHVYLGNPSSRHAVPFSSKIDIHTRLFVTATDKKKKKDKCFQLCNQVTELNISKFWAEKSDAKCGYLEVKGQDGVTDFHYILLKDAVDTTMEISFETKTVGPKVSGYISASYGDGFPYGSDQHLYHALLFKANPLEPLENKVKIPLMRSMLAVPLKGHLVIKANLVEVGSEEVIIQSSCTLKSQRDGILGGVIKGPNCSLNVTVHWKYQAQCP